MEFDPARTDPRENTALQYALIDLLIQSGIVDPEELNRLVTLWRSEMGLKSEFDPLSVLEQRGRQVEVRKQQPFKIENPRVLVIDNLKYTRDLVRNTLGSQKIQVIAEAATGNEAIEKFESYLPDVVIMDVDLKDMNGFDALRVFRQHSPQVLVIIMTGHPSLELVKKAIALGPVDFLVKPLDVNRLISTFQKLISA
jgi:two-component system chemotaxis response regulator CheY